MNRCTGFLLPATLFLAALVATGATAHPGPMEGAEHFGRFQDMMAAVDLTPEQREAIHQIMAASRQEREALRGESRAVREGLVALNPGDSDYAVQADALADAAGQLLAWRIRAMSQIRAEVYALLTPEQRAAAAEYRREQREQRGGRIGGQGRGPSRQPGLNSSL